MSEKSELQPIGNLLEACWPGEWGSDPVGDQSNCVVYRATDIDDEGHLRLEGGAERNVLPAKLFAKSLRLNDILLEASGGAPDRPVGRVALVSGPTRKAALTSNFFRLMRPKSSVDARFLTLQLVALNRSSAIWRYQQQTTGLINLKVADYLRHAIWAPKLDTQRKVADVLGCIDTAIEKTEALIAKHQQIKAGLMHDLFTRGVLPNGQLRPPRSEAPELYQETAIGWIPRDWRVKRLEEVAQVSRGKFTHRPRNDPAYLGGQHPFIQTGEVSAAGGGWVSSYSQTLSDLGTTVSQCFPQGTIAITIAANIADTALLAAPMYFPDSVVGAVVYTASNLRFVELCIRRSKRRLDAIAPQSAQKNINLQDLRPLLLPYPSKDEQDAIAARVETIQDKIDAETCDREKLKLKKLGLMQDLLTGKVVVPVQPEHTGAAA